MVLTRQDKIDLVAAEIRRRLKEHQERAPGQKFRFSEMAAEVAVDLMERMEKDGD